MDTSKVLTTVFIILLLSLSTIKGALHRVIPERYSYLNGSFTSSATPPNCEAYTNNRLSCTSSILTDNDQGPSSFSETNSEAYFTWDSPAQMLFTFSRNITLTKIRIFYYFGHGRPKVRFYIVEEDFQAWDMVGADSISTTFDIVVDDEGDTRRMSSMKSLNGITSKILMAIISEKNDVVTLSEIVFYTNSDDTATSTAPNTISSSYSTTPSGDSDMETETTSNTSHITNTTTTVTPPNNVGVVAGVLGASATSIMAAVLVAVGLVLYCKHRTTRYRVTRCVGSPDAQMDGVSLELDDKLEDEQETD